MMLSAIAAGGWWTLESTRRATLAGREQTLGAIASLLADSTQRMLADDRVSELRGLVASTGARHELGAVRVSIGGGRGAGGGVSGDAGDQLVIADASPKAGTRYAMVPEVWPEGPAEGEASVSRAGAVVQIDVPVSVPGKGTALVSVRDSGAAGLVSDWGVLAGIGAIGACGMGAVWLGYRAARRRFRALGAIREALGAIRAGETDPAALGVSAAFGPEAGEWNALVAELGDLRKRAAMDRSGGGLGPGNRRRNDGDLASLCDGLWQGLVMVDERMSVKYVNGAGAVFLGGKREELAGKDLAQLLGDEKAAEAVRGVAQGRTRSRTVVELTRAEGEGGRTVLRLTARPVRREDSATALLVVEDVTQQRVADESRQAFVASATHELRTPLTNVRLYVDQLLEDPAQDVNRRTTAMNVISGEVRRLERMIGDMLSVSQIEAGQLKLHRGEVALGPVFEELESDFAAQARQKEIGLRFELPPKWPEVEGDRDKIVMALHNLVGNAIKYTPGGGQVAVKVGCEGGLVRVEVADNGIGIKEEEQALVFEKFYRAKDRRIAGVTGTGLGLSIAREVVRLHGGEITVQSAVDKGSTFTMTLPAKAA
jgi:PAS domain S-box-containing protein